MKKTFPCVFAFLLISILVSAEGKQEERPFVLTYIRNNDNDSLQIQNGFVSEADELGVAVSVQDSGKPEEDFTRVRQQLEIAIAMGSDAIFLTSVVDSATADYISDICEEVGILLIAAYPPDIDVNPYIFGKDILNLIVDVMNGETLIPEEYELAAVYGSGAPTGTERLALEKEPAEEVPFSGNIPPAEKSTLPQISTDSEYEHEIPDEVEPAEIASEAEKRAASELEKETAVELTPVEGSKYALVVGNSDYRNFGRLKNPVNDARDISAALTKRGFQVTTLLDTDLRNFEETIREITQGLHRKDVFLFYYSGHGVQSESVNYLIPVGSTIETESDLRYEAVEVDFLLSRIEEASPVLNVVILDACRNNPFRSRFRSASRGLAVVESPIQSMVVYATSPGKVAGDGDGKNGVFTSSLLKFLNDDIVEINELFRFVGKDVSGKTGNAQTPWIHSSFYDDFYF